MKPRPTNSRLTAAMDLRALEHHMNNATKHLWYGALEGLKKLGGIGHLQDIRFGAYGTTKPRSSVAITFKTWQMIWKMRA
jgi:hypothetical protein